MTHYDLAAEKIAERLMELKDKGWNAEELYKEPKGLDKGGFVYRLHPRQDIGRIFPDRIEILGFEHPSMPRPRLVFRKPGSPIHEKILR